MTNESYGHVTPFPGDGNRHLIQENRLDNSPDDGESPITFDQYLSMQKELILGNENRRLASEALGHEPNDNELGEYYVESCQAEAFRNKHYKRVVQKKAA